MRLLVPLLLILGACSPAKVAEPPAGDPDVHSRIEAETDCHLLQRFFETFADNHELADPGSRPAIEALAYMRTVDNHMAGLDCYE
ncbi:MAG: hypothetical protein GY925_24875 [Actinomycetia bacterium]|nr:hypothetical protein [Actinomycetes bacterium]